MLLIYALFVVKPDAFPNLAIGKGELVRALKAIKR